MSWAVIAMQCDTNLSGGVIIIIVIIINYISALKCSGRQDEKSQVSSSSSTHFLLLFCPTPHFSKAKSKRRSKILASHFCTTWQNSEEDRKPTDWITYHFFVSFHSSSHPNHNLLFSRIYFFSIRIYSCFAATQLQQEQKSRSRPNLHSSPAEE